MHASSAISASRGRKRVNAIDPGLLPRPREWRPSTKTQASGVDRSTSGAGGIAIRRLRVYDATLEEVAPVMPRALTLSGYKRAPG